MILRMYFTRGYWRSIRQAMREVIALDMNDPTWRKDLHRIREEHYLRTFYK